MFNFKVCTMPKKQSLLIVNEQFPGKRNEEGGWYGETLINLVCI